MADTDIITMAHGAGGRASAELIRDVFIRAFGPPCADSLPDAALLAFPELHDPRARLAMTTDSYVVSPLFFPGGDIGSLAVCGTVNDLAVSGARPACLSAGFILEEGLPMSTLRDIVQSMARSAREAGVTIVTGDTKVVARGQVDQVYITTTGVGVVPPGIDIRCSEAKPGDAVLVNGHIGDHGASVMLARQEMGLKARLNSDCAPLNGLIDSVLNTCPDIRVMRDATRGGVGAVLCEIARDSGVTITLDESSLPIRDSTRAICDLLGMDPLFFANEGLAVFVVPQEKAQLALAAMHNHAYGQQACQVGAISESSEGLLCIKTRFGSRRMIELPYGVQLPRIC